MQTGRWRKLNLLQADRSRSALRAPEASSQAEATRQTLAHYVTRKSMGEKCLSFRPNSFTPGDFLREENRGQAEYRQTDRQMYRKEPTNFY